MSRATKSTRAHAFQSAERLLRSYHDGPNVFIVAPFSRTWYEDRATLVELFMWLDELKVSPVVLGPPAFRATAMAAAEVVDTMVSWFDEDGPEGKRFMERELELGHLVIALVGRKDLDPEHASPYVVPALERSIPVLALYADGEALFMSVLHEAGMEKKA